MALQQVSVAFHYAQEARDATRQELEVSWRTPSIVRGCGERASAHTAAGRFVRLVHNPDSVGHSGILSRGTEAAVSDHLGDDDHRHAQNRHPDSGPHHQVGDDEPLRISREKTAQKPCRPELDSG